MQNYQNRGKTRRRKSRDLRDYIKVGLFQFYPARQSRRMAQRCVHILCITAKDKQKAVIIRAQEEFQLIRLEIESGRNICTAD